MKAWELLEEKGWCQGDCAQDDAGAYAPVDSIRACSFCVIGALTRVDSDTQAFVKIEQYAKITFGLDVTEWNDDPTRTKEEVIAVLKELDI